MNHPTTITDLKEFARAHLCPESTSTNPAHRRFLAFGILQEKSEELTVPQYALCSAFIGNDFNFSIFDVKIQECGCCGAYHILGYTGECRDDKYRFADVEDATERLGCKVEEVDLPDLCAICAFEVASISCPNGKEICQECFDAGYDGDHFHEDNEFHHN